MQEHWKDDQPIYRQLQDKVVDLILEGVFAEGEAVPSVRQIAIEYSINHLTVSKAYQQLVDDGLLVKKRGIGMFVIDGARKQLLENERDKFLRIELPLLFKRVKQLGISNEEIINIMTSSAREEA
ncbi:MAG: GntR family transcriptional regulator [Gammaproteobacteria bacterium]|jgi:GntR family transcriptional regulator